MKASPHIIQIIMQFMFWAIHIPCISKKLLKRSIDHCKDGTQTFPMQFVIQINRHYTVFIQPFENLSNPCPTICVESFSRILFLYQIDKPIRAILKLMLNFSNFYLSSFHLSSKWRCNHCVYRLLWAKYASYYASLSIMELFCQ